VLRVELVALLMCFVSGCYAQRLSTVTAHHTAFLSGRKRFVFGIEKERLKHRRQFGVLVVNRLDLGRVHAAYFSRRREERHLREHHGKLSSLSRYRLHGLQVVALPLPDVSKAA
jgi:hypothetical protein